MWQRLLCFGVAGLVLVGCGGKTGNYQTDYAGPIAIQLVNQTSRPIEQIYIYPRGATKRGTSWTTIAPGAATTVKLKEGLFELVAISGKRRIDNRWVETPESTTMLELREDLASTPRKLIFHDASDTPMGVDQPGTLGIAFMISAPAKSEGEGEGEPSVAPADDAAPPTP
jgi:hypothetical protein